MGKKKRPRSPIGFVPFRPPPEHPEGSSRSHQRTHRHILVDADDGRLTTATSFFQAPSSPIKASPRPVWVDAPSDPQPNFIASFEHNFQPGEPGDIGFVDPAYVSFLDDITLEPLPTKRKRPKSVCLVTILMAPRVTINFFLVGLPSESLGFGTR